MVWSWSYRWLWSDVPDVNFEYTSLSFLLVCLRPSGRGSLEEKSWKRRWRHENRTKESRGKRINGRRGSTAKWSCVVKADAGCWCAAGGWAWPADWPLAGTWRLAAAADAPAVAAGAATATGWSTAEAVAAAGAAVPTWTAAAAAVAAPAAVAAAAAAAAAADVVGGGGDGAAARGDRAPVGCASCSDRSSGARRCKRRTAWLKRTGRTARRTPGKFSTVSDRTRPPTSRTGPACRPTAATRPSSAGSASLPVAAHALQSSKSRFTDEFNR